MKIKTSELKGAALDWAVAKCEIGELAGSFLDGVVVHPDYNKWSPSTDWAQGGPIIQREKIELVYYGTCGVAAGPWEAQIGCDIHYIDQGPGDAMAGPTPLIAAMRAYVSRKLGDDVEIPEELK